MALDDPEDARNSLAALANLIPDTMEASQNALALVTSIRPALLAREGGGVDNSLGQQFRQVAASMFVSVLMLENRLEKADGRPGVPLENAARLLREFGAE